MNTTYLLVRKTFSRRRLGTKRKTTKLNDKAIKFRWRSEKTLKKFKDNALRRAERPPI